MEGVYAKIRGQIIDYQVIVIGHLKWNPYFGEQEKAPPRGDPSTCTSVMVRGNMADGNGFVLLIDPTLRETAENYYFDINRRTGLCPEDITHCFATHSHYDHVAGLGYFPNAVWCAAKPVAEELKSSEHIDGTNVVGVEGEFLPGVYAVPLPGHTKHLHGAAFRADGRRVVAAGDGVMTRDHYRYRTTMYEQDSVAAARTIERLSRSVDIIIPGHDNLIVSNRRGGGNG